MRPPHQSDRTTTSVTGVLRQSILPAEWSARSSVCLISIACFLVPLSFFPVSLCVKPGIVSPTTHNLHCTRRLSSSFTTYPAARFFHSLFEQWHHTHVLENHFILGFCRFATCLFFLSCHTSPPCSSFAGVGQSAVFVRILAGITSSCFVFPCCKTLQSSPRSCTFFLLLLRVLGGRCRGHPVCILSCCWVLLSV